MYIKSGSDHLGTRFAATALTALIAVVATNVSAETIRTINGSAIDSAVLDYYYESRTQKPAAQATDAEREILIDELIDIFLLSTGDEAKELENDPKIKAQLELIIMRTGFASIIVPEMRQYVEELSKSASSDGVSTLLKLGKYYIIFIYFD